MSRRRSTLALATVLTAGLAAALSACAGGDDVSGEPSSDPALEPITVGGVAALVEEHLGADNVRAFGTYGSEEGSVDVMVRLRGADRRDMFMVGVTSGGVDGVPSGAAAELTCERLERRGGSRHTARVWCQDVPGGGTASVEIVPYGFSDDNAHGRVLSGMAIGPDDRFATALYDSYTRTFPVSPEDLLDLMADERLSWRTDPRVNEAGRAVEVRRLEG